MSDPAAPAAQFDDDRAPRHYGLLVDQVSAGGVEAEVTGTVATITHTVVDPRFQGQGLAGMLTRHVLDDLRGRGMSVVPQCPYTRTWIDRHPEYQDLLA